MSKTFCPLPWIHLATHPTGHVTLCCNSNHAGLKDSARNFGNFRDQHTLLGKVPINDIINSDYFKQVRSQFLNDEIPVACQGCFDKEKVGNSSKRTDSIKEFSFSVEDAKKITSATGEIIPHLEFVELRLGNLCNMRCVTCNPASSNKWIPEYQQLETDLNFVTKFNIKELKDNWSQDFNFWKDLAGYSSTIKKVYINGGEPLLNKSHFDFLEALPSETVLVYNTNLSVINTKILNAWKKFNVVYLNVSIDDLGERNDYIRYDSDWDTLMKNLNELSNYDFLRISITQTISILNIFYITEFKEFFKEYNSHFNFVSEPAFLDIKFLPDLIVKDILNRYKDCTFFSELSNYFNISNNIEEDVKVSHLLNGIKFFKWLDNSRKTSFEKTFALLHTLIKKHYEI